MSSHAFDIQGVEQDEAGTGELPSYSQVIAESPNSRFGRWKGWIEKRAAERYADLTQEELQRRRNRSWEEGQEQPGPSDDSTHFLVNPDCADVFSTPPQIRGSDSFSASRPSETCTEQVPQDNFPAPTDPASLSQRCPTSIGQTLVPTHLQVHQFGSRFLPHTKSPIHCVLPLQRDRMLLIGTDNGLSVMDMYPVEWASGDSINIGFIQKGPSDALARVIWTGEAVYQLSILEYEDIGEGTPQGVVLALVGPDPDAPSLSTSQESLRSLRMYNLTSLISLAKWMLTQHDPNPVDLRRPSDWNIKHTPVKKHRSASSITKGIKSLIIDTPPRPQHLATSYEAYLSAPSSKPPAAAAPTDPSWDIVEDLPLRWATGFVPLATSTSRLGNANATCYALWQDGGPGPGGGRHGRRALLAVATKSHIYLYETPKGERAFHFVKEFYTPMQPRGLSFCHQAVQNITRSLSDSGPIRVGGGKDHSYGAQMAIFVTFDKKAGIIRIADSAVTEVELYEVNGGLHCAKDPLGVGNGPLSRRSRASVDFTVLREGKGQWILPCMVELPCARVPEGVISPRSMYVLTRGKQSQIFPAPLPATIQATPPFFAVTWNAHPSSVSCRVCLPPPPKYCKPTDTLPFMQLIGLGEDGIEVHEVPLAALSQKGKNREGVVPFETLHAQSFIGETGFLAHGGTWHQFGSCSAPQLQRTDSGASTSSCESIESDEAVSRVRAAAGIYCWLRKGAEDWRVFWVGGDTKEGEHDEDEDGVLV